MATTSIPTTQLDGAAVIVTGAGSGIGRGSALAFARRGASVLVSDLDEGRAAAVTTEITEAGGRSLAVGADVTVDGTMERLRDACLEHFGKVDVVMNNVGVLAMGAPEAIPVEAWQRVIDINLMSMVRSNLIFVPLFIEQGHGHIVNTASLSGLLAHGFDRLPYVATKHAVVGMSESLAMYLRPKGVGVTCLCPAGVKTNIQEQITFYGEPTTPRTPDYPFAEPADVGELVAEAVTHGRFLVLTAPGIHAELVERITDVDAYVAKIADESM